MPPAMKFVAVVLSICAFAENYDAKNAANRPELQGYQDFERAFQYPTMYYGCWKNYEQETGDKCFVEKQLAPVENGRVKFNNAHMTKDGKVNANYNVTYLLRSGRGYNISNIQDYPLNGTYIPFRALYAQYGNCIILNPVTVNRNACVMIVTVLFNVDLCCVEMYDYLCGPKKIPLYQHDCAQVYGSV
ncbi:uncharacterized protein LOC135369047 [Ornithodoros turicata]|uniref:uncharacterized protein LOC135369047 n=1 Tax=Ornithodoros turicata TaxID=34597 RepID=UPI003139637C